MTSLWENDDLSNDVCDANDVTLRNGRPTLTTSVTKDRIEWQVTNGPTSDEPTSNKKRRFEGIKETKEKHLQS